MKKISFTLVVIVVLTLASLVYVFQQTEILRTAYNIEDKSRKLELLIDENFSLRYNLGRLESLERLGKTAFSKSDNFVLPVSSQVVEIQAPQARKNSEVAKFSPRAFNNLFTRLFSLKSEAEAKPIK